LKKKGAVVSKIKIMIVSDDPNLQTGFAGVGRHIADWFYKKPEKYEVAYFGWFHKKGVKQYDIPYKFYHSVLDANGAPHHGDVYGGRSLVYAIEDFSPDIVISIGDIWMVAHIKDLPNRQSFKYIMYLPVDGEPYPMAFMTQGVQTVPVLSDADVVVAYGPFGARVLSEINGVNVTRWIPHGVDTDVFKPLSIPKDELRAKLFNLEGTKDKIRDGDFIVICVSRNNPRKQWGIMAKAWKYFARGKKDVWSYWHVPLDDLAGWNIYELVYRYGIRDRVILNTNLHVGVGVSDETLNEIYNCGDLFVMPTAGEGFFCPALESMAAGLPVLVTNYSGHVDFVKGCGELIDPDEIVPEIHTNIGRAIVNHRKLAKAMERLYSDRNKLKGMSTVSRKRALKYDWSNVCSRWEKLVDETYWEDKKIKRPKKGSTKSIVFISHYYDPPFGGAEYVMQDVLPYLAEKGYDVNAYCWGTKNSTYTKNGVKVFTASGNKIDNSIKVADLYGSLSIKDFDAVITQLYPSWNIVDMADEAGVPSILCVHSTSEHFARNCYENCPNMSMTLGKIEFCDMRCASVNNIYKTNIIGFEKASEIVSNSEFTRNLVQRWYGKDSRIIYPIVDRGPKEVQTRVGEYITSVRTNYLKGAGIIFKLAEMNPDKTFLIVGVTDKYTAERLRLYKNIMYIPSVCNMDEVYRVTRVLLHPVFEVETFGRTVYEAMQWGIPIISSEREFITTLGEDKIKYVNCDPTYYKIDEWQRKLDDAWHIKNVDYTSNILYKSLTGYDCREEYLKMVEEVIR